MAHIYNLAIEGCLLFLIVLTPLAFGAVYDWGMTLMECTALLMVLAWVLKLLHAGVLRAVRTPLNLPILLFLVLVGLQLLPLPPALLHVVSPQTYALNQRALEGWPEREVLPFVPREASSQQPGSVQDGDQASPCIFIPS